MVYAWDLSGKLGFYEFKDQNIIIYNENFFHGFIPKKVFRSEDLPKVDLRKEGSGNRLPNLS